MKALVIDGSTALGFLMHDEQHPDALKSLEAIERGIPTFVPAHWCVEVANGLVMAERRKRASQANITEALHLVSALPVIADDETARVPLDQACTQLRLCHAMCYYTCQGRMVRDRHIVLLDTRHKHFSVRALIVDLSRATHGHYLHAGDDTWMGWPCCN